MEQLESLKSLITIVRDNDTRMSLILILESLAALSAKIDVLDNRLKNLTSMTNTANQAQQHPPMSIG